MEKTNDTMTICTLAKPDTISISTREYRDFLDAQRGYENVLNLLLKSISLDSDGNAELDYKDRTRLLNGLEIIEPEALNFRLRQLREKAVNGGE